MSIIAMVDARIRRDVWRDIEKNPERRVEIRDAARAVLDARTDVEEFRAIVALSKAFPR